MKLPHFSTYKHRWLRRVFIVLLFPKGLCDAVAGAFGAARQWWDWDGTVMSADHVWTLPDGRQIPVPIFKK